MNMSWTHIWRRGAGENPGVSSNKDAGTSRQRRGAARRRGGRRGSALLMALMYVTLFGALAASMTMFSTATMDDSAANDRSTRAYAAADSGISWLMLQFKMLAQKTPGTGGGLPMTTAGTINAATARTLFSGTGGLAPNLATQVNGTTNLQGRTVIWNTTAISIPPIQMFGSGDSTCFCVTLTQDATTPTILHAVSIGKCSNVLRSVQMDITMSKQLKYAVYSNVAIQLGKNVRVQGDIASTYAGTGKGPPIQSFSDFHYIKDLAAVDTSLGTLRNLLATYDTTYANRLDVRNASSPAAVAAASAGLTDANGDGFIDEYDIFLKAVDTNGNKVVTPGEYTDPLTGKAYDADLWALVDAPFGATTPVPWLGYNDNQISNYDGYSKFNGTLKMAITPSQWQANAANWPLWGDGGGTRTQDFIEGPVIPSDPTAVPVQFGYDFSSDLTMTPQNFDTSGLDANVSASNATVAGATISNGTLTAAMANGGTLTEHSPSDVTSGWQATYKRPVFQNMTFNNVRIPKGLNAKFVNCTFNGYTTVKENTNVVTGGSIGTLSDGTKGVTGGTTTSDPSNGMAYAQRMISGSFTADTTLTSSNSVAFTQGNNLHFTGCTFNGVLSSDVPTSYTHFANTWEFDGVSTFNNQVDQTQTIMAPNTNIEMGSFTNPGGNPSTLFGVVVAGNIDIRGTANVDGSLIVTGNGATNTTLGYFGSTDSGQAVPPISQLPTAANGAYGHLYFRYNPSRGMPNGISIPVTLSTATSTYSQVSVYTWPW